MARSIERRPATAGPRSLVTEVGSLLAFAGGAFLLCAILTFNPKDPSAFTEGSVAATNACGPVGAYLSALLLHIFGLGGFLVPAALFFLSATLHRRQGSARFFTTVVGMCVAVVALSVFLTLQWKYWPYSGTLLLTGGVFGMWLSELLLKPFNPVGSSIVSLLMFLLAIVMSTPVSVTRVAAVIFGVSWRVLSRSVRFAGSLLVYFFGVLFMKAAHGTGDLLHRLMEGALEQARARAAALAIRKPAAATAMTGAVAVAGEGSRPIIDVSSVEDEPSMPALGAPATLLGPDGEPAFELGLDLDADDADFIPRATPVPPPAPAAAVAASAPRIIVQEQAPAAASTAPPKLAKPPVRRGGWKLPTVEFLKKAPRTSSSVDRERLTENSRILTAKLKDFDIDGEVVAVSPGPVITLYEFRPGPGVKVSRISALADDLAMALSAKSVRILAPLPGKSVVGIEIPSERREMVFLREFLENGEFFSDRYSMPLVMGKDIAGKPVYSDLARMPHLLCAGQTGSGKSVFMNSLICSLLYRFTPEELRMVLVDPKFIEFRAYQDIPHLLLPVVDDPKDAGVALKWAVREMERRYRILAMVGVRNLAGYNQKVEELGEDVIHDLLHSEENPASRGMKSSGNDWVQAYDVDDSGLPRIGKLPYILVIIDELADLMMICKKDVEISIARIAQKARAAGIHLVIATQRPSTDVITGLIKANLPSRTSFQLASYVDSKTILDRAGAERLLGHGDMLFIPPGSSQLQRLHGAWVEDEEIGKITKFLKSQGEPIYREEILVDEDEEDADTLDGEDGGDELFQQAVELVQKAGHASASYLQRHLKVGYNRAARMIETMEARGIVGPADGSRPREILLR